MDVDPPNRRSRGLCRGDRLRGRAHAQVNHWRSDLVLWIRTLEVTSQNNLAHNHLGLALANAGRVDEAIAEYRESLRLTPGYMDAHNNLGSALVKLGKYAEAASEFREAVRLNPMSANAQSNLGLALMRSGVVEPAMFCLLNADALNNLEAALRLGG
jgi:Flp pilus assembly protein TadD